jgi:glucose dehydrogenase
MVTVQKEDPKLGATFFGGVLELRKPLKGDPGGHFDAVDPVTGNKQWTYKSKYPLLASALATGGDLVFTGAPEGNFLAFDTRHENYGTSPQDQGIEVHRSLIQLRKTI